MTPPPEAEDFGASALERGRRWVAVAIGVGVLLYVAYALWHGIEATASAIRGFDWPLYAAVLGLTGINYALRYAKWTYLLRRVGVRLSHRANLWIFTAGFAMVISPGKVGELVKPWLVRSASGASMLRTVPALVTERVTDGIAVVALAALGVSTYGAQNAGLLLLSAGAIAAGLLVLASETLSLGVLGALARLPVVGRFAPRLTEMYRAMRSCVAPGPLLLTVVISLLAWGAECIGLWLVFLGLGVATSLDLSTFLYATATVVGGPSPGGIGLADAALVEGALALIRDIEPGQAMAAALLIRVATLWFGVVIGALALLRIDGVILRERRRGHTSPRPGRDAPAP